jgi:hypothetical protein
MTPVQLFLGVYMPAEPTDYERVNVIVPRELKRELIRHAENNESSLTRIMRIALRDYLTNHDKSQEKKSCQKKTRSRH